MSKQKKKRKILNKIYVGTYLLKGYKHKVYLIPDDSSARHEWAGANDKKTLPFFNIGIGNVLSTGNWATFYENLLHEVFEVLSTDMGLSFEKTYSFTRAADNRWFYMSHADFGELCATVGDLFTDLLPDAIREINKRIRKCK